MAVEKVGGGVCCQVGVGGEFELFYRNTRGAAGNGDDIIVGVSCIAVRQVVTTLLFCKIV